jgi:predicted nucleotidyltransferase
MTRSSILSLLSEHLSKIRENYGVSRLALFGSAARDELRPDSDVDVLVEFDGPATFDHYFNLKSYLEQLLQRRVDLVTNRGLKPRARREVEKDLIRVA